MIRGFRNNFATYFYRREITGLYFCQIVKPVDKGLHQATIVDGSRADGQGLQGRGLRRQ